MPWTQLSEQQGKAIQEIEQSGSQRIIAVVGGALLDQSLRLTIQHRMQPDKEACRKLLKETGPLGGQNKVTLGYLLGMFDKPTRDALDAIYVIRNLFAHNLEMSFESENQLPKKSLDALNLHIGRTHYPHPFLNEDSDHPIEPISDSKTRFLVNLKIALIILLADLRKHVPWTNIPHEVYCPPPKASQ